MAFHNARNVGVHDGKFVSAKKATYNDNSTTTNYFTQPTTSRDPLQVLLENSAIEATHESATAFYAPRCHPGTRKKVIGDIMAWATAATDDFVLSKAILWFSGPAGGGKTCIKREVARLCAEQDTLAASFFFSTRVADLDNARAFVATLAYQLASSIEGLEPFIAYEIQHDRAIFKKSLHLQFQRLISRPLTRFLSDNMRNTDAHNQPKQPDIIVIDGLDECRDRIERTHILRLISAAVADQSLPLRFAICSRPEYDIRTEFEEEMLKRHTRRIKLEDYGGDQDIRDYLVDSLFDIRTRHPSSSTIPITWPSEDDIDILVSKASRQFIYASTVIKFVNNPRRLPIEMLKFVMDLKSDHNTGNPFSELDALYAFVLNPPDTDLPLLKRLLHGMLGIRKLGGSSNPIPSPLLDQLYCLEPGTAEATFCDMHSLLNIPDSNVQFPYSLGSIEFHHKSLEDYLLSQSRAGSFFQSSLTTHQDLLGLCTHHLKSWAAGDPAKEDRAIAYAALFWHKHASPVLDQGATSCSDFLDLPEIAIKYTFLILFTISSYDGLKDRIHLKKLCPSEDAAFLLCRKLSHISQVHDKIVTLRNSVVDGPFSKALRKLPELEKLLALPDIDVPALLAARTTTCPLFLAPVLSPLVYTPSLPKPKRLFRKRRKQKRVALKEEENQDGPSFSFGEPTTSSTALIATCPLFPDPVTSYTEDSTLPFPPIDSDSSLASSVYPTHLALEEENQGDPSAEETFGFETAIASSTASITPCPPFHNPEVTSNTDGPTECLPPLDSSLTPASLTHPKCSDKEEKNKGGPSAKGTFGFGTRTRLQLQLPVEIVDTVLSVGQTCLYPSDIRHLLLIYAAICTYLVYVRVRSL